MKDWFKDNKYSIITGVSVFIVSTISPNIVYVFFYFVPSSSKSIFILLRDSVYYRAGQMNLYGVISSQWSLLCNIFCGIISGSFLSMINKAIRKYNKKEDSVSKEQEYIENHKVKDNIFELAMNDVETLDEQELKKIIATKYILELLNNRKQEDFVSKFKNKIKKKHIKYLLILFICALALFMSLNFIYFKPANLWNSFEMSITKITPYVEDNEIKKLRSKWVSMNSKDDYLEIENYIKEIKKKNNLK